MSELSIATKNFSSDLIVGDGRIVNAWQHEEADSLYVEEVDIGEVEPIIICSGLVKYVPLDLLQGAAVVVLANLKPRNMRGVKSCGMLLAASDAAHENVELMVPPQGSVPGDRVWFGNEDEVEQLPEPAPPNKVQKKKMWERGIVFILPLVNFITLILPLVQWRIQNYFEPGAQ